MYQSLRRLGERLPEQTLIRPGHNYGITPTSTLLEQLAGNRFCTSTIKPTSSTIECICMTAKSHTGQNRIHSVTRIDGIDWL